MEYHVFNKRPSKSAVAKAAQWQDAKEQQDELALATFPEKGELWQNENTGRLVVIKSNHITIPGTHHRRRLINWAASHHRKTRRNGALNGLSKPTYPSPTYSGGGIA